MPSSEVDTYPSNIRQYPRTGSPVVNESSDTPMEEGIGATTSKVLIIGASETDAALA